LGICSCDPGYYGFDCSILLDGDCVSSPLFPLTCWNITFLDCRTFQIKITSPQRQINQVFKLDEITSFQIIPCTPFLNDDRLVCEICIDMENITVQGTELIGCPTIKTSCNYFPVSDNQMECITLATTTDLICYTPVPLNPDGNYNMTDSPDITTSKIILLVLVSVLGVLILLGMGYIFITKYLGFSPKLFVDKKPVTYIEDEEPLHDDEEDS
jgi:hypothetical protein